MKKRKQRQICAIIFINCMLISVYASTWWELITDDCPKNKFKGYQDADCQTEDPNLTEQLNNLDLNKSCQIVENQDIFSKYGNYYSFKCNDYYLAYFGYSNFECQDPPIMTILMPKDKCISFQIESIPEISGFFIMKAIYFDAKKILLITLIIYCILIIT